MCCTHTFPEGRTLLRMTASQKTDLKCYHNTPTRTACYGLTQSAHPPECNLLIFADRLYMQVWLLSWKGVDIIVSVLYTKICSTPRSIP